MTAVNRRKAASAVAIVLYVVAFAVARQWWFVGVSVAIIFLELSIQRASEIGWRFFRQNLDERQEELQNRVLSISYRIVVATVLVLMVFLAAFGWYLGSPARLSIPGEFAAMAARTMAFVLVVLFLLPGHVSAWVEPAPEGRGARDRANGGLPLEG